MEIPKTVKVGGINYEVKFTNEWPNHDFDDGETFYDKTNGNVIFIREDLSKEAKEAKEITFLHEVFHAMNSTMNHEFLDSLAEQLYQVLIDNKLLI
jgi:hypothetical protein